MWIRENFIGCYRAEENSTCASRCSCPPGWSGGEPSGAHEIRHVHHPHDGRGTVIIRIDTCACTACIEPPSTGVLIDTDGDGHVDGVDVDGDGQADGPASDNDGGVGDSVGVSVDSDGDFSTEDDGTDNDGVGGPPTGSNPGGYGTPGDGNANGGGGSKPIILDLDGDGVELVPLDESTAFFDLNGDGYREQMAWAAADDGFLAYDKDGDGVIEAYDEISFVTYVENAETDLEGLCHFDTDGDGMLDADDAEWGMFRVWRDLDQDGESDEGELRSLDEAGIVSVALTSDTVERQVGGSTVYGEGVYVGPHGPRAFWDVVLEAGPRVE